MRIFLSYSFSDKSKIINIVDFLRMNSENTFIDYEGYVNKNEKFLDALRYSIEQRDVVLLFLSNNFFASEFSQQELSQSLNELRMRKIKIIPVVVEKCLIPSSLLEFEVIDLTKSTKGHEKLLDRLRFKETIKFDNLNSSIYEEIVKLFLKEYGFKIKNNDQFNKDYGIDYICEYIAKDPFGNKKVKPWLVEVKYYKQERFSINSIHQLYNTSRSILSKKANLLLITNSILTSATIEYLNHLKEEDEISITVIDGPTFEQLVLKRKRLTKKVREVINASNK